MTCQSHAFNFDELLYSWVFAEKVSCSIWRRGDCVGDCPLLPLCRWWILPSLDDLTNKFCFVVEWGNLNRNHVIFGEPSDGFSKALIMMSDWNCSWQRFWKYFGPDESNLFSAILVWPWRGYFRGGLNSPLFSSLFHYPSLVFTLFFL